MIRKIKWRNHNILGDLELDFTKSDGSIYKNIVVAGENGTGKSTILQTISGIFDIVPPNSFDFIDYEIDDTIYEIYYDEKNNQGNYRRKKYETDNTAVIYDGIYGFQGDNDFTDIRYYGMSYSKARTGFNANQVTTVKTEQLDTIKYDNDDVEDYTSLIQLLVDLNNQDAIEWKNISKKRIAMTFDEFEIESKLSRFTRAFNSFFENLQFKEIRDQFGTKDIIFEKNGQDISISSLSTGEKQIVFRGTKLLRNMKSIRGGIVLIDEPELSMHPRWQKKILDYYKNMFVENSVQQVQMIVATHSEFVIESALSSSEDTLVIVMKEKGGIITAEKMTAPYVLPSVTAAETNYLAFNILSNDYHNQLYGFLQSKNKIKSVSDCDSYIKNHILYNSSMHEKKSSNNSTQYFTICTYIRNAIDHPDSGNTFTEEELKKSTELLIKVCK